MLGNCEQEWKFLDYDILISEVDSLSKGFSLPLGKLGLVLELSIFSTNAPGVHPVTCNNNDLY